jgi:hypothetical protein
MIERLSICCRFEGWSGTQRLLSGPSRRFVEISDLVTTARGRHYVANNQTKRPRNMPFRGQPDAIFTQTIADARRRPLMAGAADASTMRMRLYLKR